MNEQHIYIYYPPVKGEVRRIWDECQLGGCADGNTVKQTLLVWVYNNTYMKNSKIAWRDPSNVGYEMTWAALLRWFDMACTKEHMIIKNDGHIQPNEQPITPEAFSAHRGYSEQTRADDGEGKPTELQ
jgi:hypothetical protein